MKLCEIGIRRCQHRGQNESQHHRVAEMPDEAAGGNQAELGEKHHHDRQLEDQAKGNHQTQAERDVVTHRQVRGDVVAGEAKQER